MYRVWEGVCCPLGARESYESAYLAVAYETQGNSDASIGTYAPRHHSSAAPTPPRRRPPAASREVVCGHSRQLSSGVDGPGGIGNQELQIHRIEARFPGQNPPLCHL